MTTLCGPYKKAQIVGNSNIFQKFQFLSILGDFKIARFFQNKRQCHETALDLASEADCWWNLHSF